MIDYVFKYSIVITIEMRSSKAFMGRFGGGWNWKLGFQAGGSSIIFNLLIFDIRIGFVNEKEKRK